MTSTKTVSRMYGRIGRGNKVHSFSVRVEGGKITRVSPRCGSGTCFHKSDSHFSLNPDLTADDLTCSKCRELLGEIDPSETDAPAAPVVEKPAMKEKDEEAIKTAVASYRAALKAQTAAERKFKNELAKLDGFALRQRRRELFGDLVVDLAAAERQLIDVILADLDRIADNMKLPRRSAEYREQWATGKNLDGKQKLIELYLNNQ